MKRRRPFLFSLTGLLGLTLLTWACGRQSDAPQDVFYPTETLPQAQALFLKTHVSCNPEQNPRDCDPAVGMLVAASERGVQMCTAFLVGPNLMATNRHCLPADLWAVPALCDGRLQVIFPANPKLGLAEARVDCSEVVEVSDPSEHSKYREQDYAFFKLKSSPGRAPVKLSDQGAAEGDLVEVHKMSPTEAKLQGIIESVRCSPIYRTFIALLYDQPLFEIITLRDCDLKHGNSGSPVLNEQQEVVAIGQGGYDKNFFDQHTPPAFVESPVLLGVASNLACIESPRVKTFNRGCVASDALRNLEAHQRQAREALEKSLRKLNASLDSAALDPDFKWTYAETATSPLADGQRYVVPIPRCYEDRAAVEKRLRTQSSMSLSVASLPIYQVEQRLDRLSHVVVQVSASARSLPSAEFDLDALDWHESGRLFASAPGLYLKESSWDVGPCAPSQLDAGVSELP